MKVAWWAEIRRLSEIEKLSGHGIARRLHCSRHTVAAALKRQQPLSSQTVPRARVLDPYLDRIKELLAKYPDLSAVRIHEEIARGPEGYTGSVHALRRYLRQVRPARVRVYQEVHYEPAQAMQVDWGECGRVQVGATMPEHRLAARYESGSIVLTINRAFREWGTLLDVDHTLATALIDRLMHHGEPLVINGVSYRMKDKDNPSDPSA